MAKKPTNKKTSKAPSCACCSSCEAYAKNYDKTTKVKKERSPKKVQG